jgi:hypothetical protein
MELENGNQQKLTRDAAEKWLRRSRTHTNAQQNGKSRKIHRQASASH